MLFLSSFTTFIIKFIHSSVGKVLINLSCISFTIKNIGYCKSKSIVYPLEKFILIKLDIFAFSGFSIDKADEPILKFKITVKQQPIFNFRLLKSISKKPSPEQQK